MHQDDTCVVRILVEHNYNNNQREVDKMDRKKTGDSKTNRKKRKSLSLRIKISLFFS